MSLLVIRSALEFFPCPISKFHEDTSCELVWSSEFFFLVEWTKHFQHQASVMHLYISTCSPIWIIHHFFSLFCSDIIRNGMPFTILWELCYLEIRALG